MAGTGPRNIWRTTTLFPGISARGRDHLRPPARGSGPGAGTAIACVRASRRPGSFPLNGVRMRLVEEPVREAAPRDRGHEAEEGGGAGPDAAPLVLVVEDEPAVRAALRALLEQEGYRVAETAVGEEALPLARRLRPDVVLLDLVLPAMSGLDTVRALKEDAETAAIPVIATSGLRLPGPAALAAAGFAGALGKPYRGAELFAELRRVLAPADHTGCPPRG